MDRSTAQARRRPQPRLILNLLPVQVTGDAFEVDVAPYRSSEQLRDLRRDLAGTHAVHRRGDEILCVPITDGAPEAGSRMTLHASEAPSVVRRLVQEALIRFVGERGYKLRGWEPTFVARLPRLDLAASACSTAGVEPVGWLHVYPEYSLAPKVIYRRSGAHLMGVVVGLRTRREIPISVHELIEHGVNVDARYVLVRSPREEGPDPRWDEWADLRLAGRVVSHELDVLRLDDVRGPEQVRASEAFLEARRENVEACLVAECGSVAPRVIEALDDATSGLTGARGRLDRVRAIAELLEVGGSFLLTRGVEARIQPPMEIREGSDAGSYRRQQRVSYVFDPARTKTDTWLNRGLQEHGPFDAEAFTTKRPIVCVICPADWRGEVELYLRQFRDGVPSSKVFGQGFVRKYHLNDCTFQFHLLRPGNDAASAYREACLAALDTTDSKPNLAFVIIEERYKELPPQADPYLASKAAFLSQGVPVQEIEIETIRVSPRQHSSVQYSLDNIALASYAKLGGVPFVMASAPGLAHELVIGIGSATLSSGRLGAYERVVGITTVFSADGNYLLANSSREVDFQEYGAELMRTLEAGVRQVARRNGWQPGDDVRLVFHVFKPLKDAEAEAVKQLVGQLFDYRVEYAFLHVSEDHSWCAFDEAATGVLDWEAPAGHQRLKGECVPERGLAIPISDREALLTVTGPRELKTGLQGAPRPLLLTLHRESTFRDMGYLTTQAFRFTNLSWRTFLPGSRPVTIHYSDLLASLLGRLRGIRNWNPDVLETALRGSRWFL